MTDSQGAEPRHRDDENTTWDETWRRMTEEAGNKRGKRNNRQQTQKHTTNNQDHNTQPLPTEGTEAWTDPTGNEGETRGAHEIRIMTWNIQGGALGEREGRKKLDAVIQVATQAEVEVILLQETTSQYGGAPAQIKRHVAYIARRRNLRLRVEASHAPAHDTLGAPQGIWTILLGDTSSRVTTTYASDSGRALLVEIAGKGSRRWACINAYLPTWQKQEDDIKASQQGHAPRLGEGRAIREQLARWCSAETAKGATVIMGGDFNAIWDENGAENKLLREGERDLLLNWAAGAGLHRIPTHDTTWTHEPASEGHTKRTLDHIFCSSQECIITNKAWVGDLGLGNVQSDHRPIIAGLSRRHLGIDRATNNTQTNVRHEFPESTWFKWDESSDSEESDSNREQASNKGRRRHLSQHDWHAALDRRETYITRLTRQAQSDASHTTDTTQAADKLWQDIRNLGRNIRQELRKELTTRGKPEGQFYGGARLTRYLELRKWQRYHGWETPQSTWPPIARELAMEYERRAPLPHGDGYVYALDIYIRYERKNIRQLRRNTHTKARNKGNTEDAGLFKRVFGREEGVRMAATWKRDASGVMQLHSDPQTVTQIVKDIFATRVTVPEHSWRRTTTTLTQRREGNFDRRFHTPGPEDRPELQRPWSEVLDQRKAPPLPEHATDIHWTQERLRDQLKEANVDTSPGPSGLSYRMILHGTPHFQELLVAFMNLQRTTSRYAHGLSRAWLAPVPKKGPQGKFLEGARDVCLVETPLKIMQRALSQQIQEHCLQFGLRKEQVGYIAEQSAADTAAALGELTSIMRTLRQRDAGGELHLFSMDIVGAYLSVPHWAMEVALRRYNINERAISRFLSNDRDRQLQVKTVHGLTEPFDKESGCTMGDAEASLKYMTFIDIILDYIAELPPHIMTDIQLPIDNEEPCTIRAGAFADDAFGVQTTHLGIQRIASAFSYGLILFGGEVSVPKSVYSAIEQNGKAPNNQQLFIWQRNNEQLLKQNIQWTPPHQGVRILGGTIEVRGGWTSLEQATDERIRPWLATIAASQTTLPERRKLISGKIMGLLRYVYAVGDIRQTLRQQWDNSINHILRDGAQGGDAGLPASWTWASKTVGGLDGQSTTSLWIETTIHHCLLRLNKAALRAHRAPWERIWLASLQLLQPEPGEFFSGDSKNGRTSLLHAARQAGIAGNITIRDRRIHATNPLRQQKDYPIWKVIADMDEDKPPPQGDRTRLDVWWTEIKATHALEYVSQYYERRPILPRKESQWLRIVRSYISHNDNKYGRNGSKRYALAPPARTDDITINHTWNTDDLTALTHAGEIKTNKWHHDQLDQQWRDYTWIAISDGSASNDAPRATFASITLHNAEWHGAAGSVSGDKNSLKGEIGGLIYNLERILTHGTRGDRALIGTDCQVAIDYLRRNITVPQTLIHNQRILLRRARQALRNIHNNGICTSLWYVPGHTEEADTSSWQLQHWCDRAAILPADAQWATNTMEHSTFEAPFGIHTTTWIEGNWRRAIRQHLQRQHTDNFRLRTNYVTQWHQRALTEELRLHTTTDKWERRRSDIRIRQYRRLSTGNSIPTEQDYNHIRNTKLWQTTAQTYNEHPLPRQCLSCQQHFSGYPAHHVLTACQPYRQLWDQRLTSLIGKWHIQHLSHSLPQALQVWNKHKHRWQRLKAGETWGGFVARHIRNTTPNEQASTSHKQAREWHGFVNTRAPEKNRYKHKQGFCMWVCQHTSGTASVTPIKFFELMDTRIRDQPWEERNQGEWTRAAIAEETLEVQRLTNTNDIRAKDLWALDGWRTHFLEQYQPGARGNTHNNRATHMIPFSGALNQCGEQHTGYSIYRHASQREGWLYDAFRTPDGEPRHTGGWRHEFKHHGLLVELNCEYSGHTVAKGMTWAHNTTLAATNDRSWATIYGILPRRSKNRDNERAYNNNGATRLGRWNKQQLTFIPIHFWIGQSTKGTGKHRTAPMDTSLLAWGLHQPWQPDIWDKWLRLNKVASPTGGGFTPSTTTEAWGTAKATQTLPTTTLWEENNELEHHHRDEQQDIPTHLRKRIKRQTSETYWKNLIDISKDYDWQPILPWHNSTSNNNEDQTQRQRNDIAGRVGHITENHRDFLQFMGVSDKEIQQLAALLLDAGMSCTTQALSAWMAGEQRATKAYTKTAIGKDPRSYGTKAAWYGYDPDDGASEWRARFEQEEEQWRQQLNQDHAAPTDTPPTEPPRNNITPQRPTTPTHGRFGTHIARWGKCRKSKESYRLQRQAIRIFQPRTDIVEHLRIKWRGKRVLGHTALSNHFRRLKLNANNSTPRTPNVSRARTPDNPIWRCHHCHHGIGWNSFDVGKWDNPFCESCLRLITVNNISDTKTCSRDNCTRQAKGWTGDGEHVCIAHHADCATDETLWNLRARRMLRRALFIDRQEHLFSADKTRQYLAQKADQLQTTLKTTPQQERRYPGDAIDMRNIWQWIQQQDWSYFLHTAQRTQLSQHPPQYTGPQLRLPRALPSLPQSPDRQPPTHSREANTTPTYAGPAAPHQDNNINQGTAATTTTSRTSQERQRSHNRTPKNIQKRRRRSSPRQTHQVSTPPQTGESSRQAAARQRQVNTPTRTPTARTSTPSSQRNRRTPQHQRYQPTAPHRRAARKLNLDSPMGNTTTTTNYSAGKPADTSTTATDDNSYERATTNTTRAPTSSRAAGPPAETNHAAGDDRRGARGDVPRDDPGVGDTAGIAAAGTQESKAPSPRGRSEHQRHKKRKRQSTPHTPSPRRDRNTQHDPTHNPATASTQTQPHPPGTHTPTTNEIASPTSKSRRTEDTEHAKTRHAHTSDGTLTATSTH